ncbi:MAG: PilW family protein [Sulfuriferula sp.]
MSTKKLSSIVNRSQRGFSLVELMVAMTLGLIVLGAVGYLYLGSRQTFRTTDAVARIQENARFALQTMAYDVRMAGYVGCAGLGTQTKSIANSLPAVNMSNAITGWDSGAGAAAFGGVNRVAGDAISIIGAFGGGVNLTGNLAPANANVKVLGNPYGFQKDDVLVVTDCKNADIFQVTNSPGNAGSTTLPTTLTIGNGSNTGNRVVDYGQDAYVMKIEQYTYFIGTNPSGGRSLYRSSLSEGTVEVADNVWDMQIQYGIDPTNSGSASSYSTAGAVANWSQVVSARISLLLVSQDNVLSAPQTYTYYSDTSAAPTSFTPGAGAPDRLRMHQVFTTTVGVRNRLAYGA